MPRDLPNPLRLREIKYGTKTSPGDQVATARALLSKGRTAEALDLFLLAGDEDGIAEVRNLALAEGRPVLLLMLQRARREVSPEEWNAAGDAARAAGRCREAYRCFKEAGNEEALAELREQLPGYEIYTPQGK